MQQLARQGHTADEVRATITGDAPAVSWGVDLLDLDDQPIGDLSDDVTACTVSRSMYADIHGTVAVTVTSELDWPGVRVRPWQAIDGVRFDLGVYGLETPESAADTGTFDVQGYDKLAGLRNIIGDSYTVASGVEYLTAITDAVTASGMTGVQVLLDTTAAGDMLDSAMVWALDVQAPASYLRVVNDLLSAIGYRGVWADEDGHYRSEPYQPPEQRASEWTFDLSDVATDIVAPGRTVTLDNWQRTNWWRFLRNGMSAQPVEGAGLYTVDLSGSSRKVRAFYAVDASSQASLESQGDRQVQADTSRTRLVDITFGPLPCLGHFDIVTYRDAAMGVDTRCQVRSWEQSLTEASCKATLEML